MKLSRDMPRQGFTLLEMVATMGTMVAAFFLGGTILIGALQTEQAATTAGRRMLDRNALANQFRGDIAEAVAAPTAFEFGQKKETARPTCLILAWPDKRAIVYLWAGGELWRWDTSGGKLLKQRLSVGSDCTGVEFMRGPPGENPLHTMRLKLKGPTGKPDRTIELNAVQGGDLR